MGWLKQHWDECLFGAIVVAVCCQVFSWLWPVSPVYQANTRPNAQEQSLLKPYRLTSTVAVKQQPVKPDTPISLYQLAELPKSQQYHKPALEQTLQPVNVNRASATQLEALPGVGPQLARRIIDFRQKQKLASLQDLDQVKGIGPSLLARLEPYLKF